MSKIKVVVFDLDGTLYEDTHHFAYYAARIKDKLPASLQAPYESEYQRVLLDEHPLKIGRVYDLQEDKILVVVKGKVLEGFHWDGSAVNSAELSNLYPDYVPIDMERFFSIGDMWWPPSTIGRHFGLTREQTNSAFLETRDYMVSSEFVMNPVPGFKDVLVRLKETAKLVLLTNSPQPDSEAILVKLSLGDVFDKKIFSGKKPNQTLTHFENLTREFGVDYGEILSVGDNWLNEILPAQEQGMATIYIDTHGIATRDSADVVVNSVGELVEYLLKS